MGWTRSKSWATGHQSQVETFAGASLPAPWGSNSSSTGVVDTQLDANATTVTDQASKVRRSITNGLGQLVRVDEPNSSNELGSITSPNQDTGYTYDVLNNLLTVVQGSQTRTFTYSSISRLRTAANPESGTISYAYDPNGNLTSKVDARSITTSYVYDALNRVTDRNYTNEPSGSETPDVDYFYGTTAPKFGKLTKVTSSVSTTEYTSFDILGRVTGHKQTTDGQQYTTGYSYNLAGALIEETYPSGRVVKNVLDNTGDLSIVQSKKNSTAGYWHYADAFTYNAAGSVTSMQLGNGKWESTSFNERLQPVQIGLGITPGASNLLKLDYSYGDWNGSSIDATKNNGNIVQQVITVPNSPGNSDAFNATQKYYYDSLNRIDDSTETVSSQTWRQDFTFDRYGNRNFNRTNTTVPASFSNPAVTDPTISTTNNRITSSGWTYDAAGNTLTDANGQSYVYDGENKQVKASNGGGTLGEYYYDGDGKRVKKVVPSTGEVTIFVYDAAGKQIAEYSTIVESVEDAKVAYLTNDHLGSPRINTDRDGRVTSRHDYHPYGEEIVTAQRTSHAEYTPDSVRKQFTGYERDHESDLDFAEARYFDSGLGRFRSPDDFVNDTSATEPAGWNLYVYVRNNPLNLTDPNGEKIYVGDIKDQKDREQFLKRANATYGCKSCVTIDKDNFLTIDASGLSKEIVKATQFLTNAINTSDPSMLFSVQITNNNDEVAFGDSRAGSAGVQLPGNNFKTSAVRIRLDFGDDKWVSGDKDAKGAFLNLVFAHEIGHFSPDFILDPDDGRRTGPVVDKVNEIQQALGLPLRAEYSARQTRRDGVWVEVGFGKAKTDKAGQPLRNNAAIQVEKQSKVVRWVKNNVGGLGIN